MCLIIYLDLPLLLGPVVVLFTGTAVSTGSLDAEGASKSSGDAESESKASRDTEDTAGVGFAANLALRLVVAPEDAGCVSPTSMDAVGESPASKDADDPPTASKDAEDGSTVSKGAKGGSTTSKDADTDVCSQLVKFLDSLIYFLFTLGCIIFFDGFVVTVGQQGVGAVGGEGVGAVGGEGVGAVVRRGRGYCGL